MDRDRTWSGTLQCGQHSRRGRGLFTWVLLRLQSVRSHIEETISVNNRADGEDTLGHGRSGSALSVSPSGLTMAGNLSMAGGTFVPAVAGGISASSTLEQWIRAVLQWLIEGIFNALVLEALVSIDVLLTIDSPDSVVGLDQMWMTALGGYATICAIGAGTWGLWYMLYDESPKPEPRRVLYRYGLSVILVVVSRPLIDALVYLLNLLTRSLMPASFGLEIGHQLLRQMVWTGSTVSTFLATATFGGLAVGVGAGLSMLGLVMREVLVHVGYALAPIFIGLWVVDFGPLKVGHSIARFLSKIIGVFAVGGVFVAATFRVGAIVGGFEGGTLILGGLTAGQVAASAASSPPTGLSSIATSPEMRTTAGYVSSSVGATPPGAVAYSAPGNAPAILSPPTADSLAPPVRDPVSGRSLRRIALKFAVYVGTVWFSIAVLSSNVGVLFAAGGGGRRFRGGRRIGGPQTVGPGTASPEVALTANPSMTTTRPGGSAGPAIVREIDPRSVQDVFDRLDVDADVVDNPVAVVNPAGDGAIFLPSKANRAIPVDASDNILELESLSRMDGQFTDPPSRYPLSDKLSYARSWLTSGISERLQKHRNDADIASPSVRGEGDGAPESGDTPASSSADAAADASARTIDRLDEAVESRPDPADVAGEAQATARATVGSTDGRDSADSLQQNNSSVTSDGPTSVDGDTPEQATSPDVDNGARDGDSSTLSEKLLAGGMRVREAHPRAVKLLRTAGSEPLGLVTGRSARYADHVRGATHSETIPKLAAKARRAGSMVRSYGRVAAVEGIEDTLREARSVLAASPILKPGPAELPGDPREAAEVAVAADATDIEALRELAEARATAKGDIATRPDAPPSVPEGELASQFDEIDSFDELDERAVELARAATPGGAHTPAELREVFDWAAHRGLSPQEALERGEAFLHTPAADPPSVSAYGPDESIVGDLESAQVATGLTDADWAYHDIGLGGLAGVPPRGAVETDRRRPAIARYEGLDLKGAVGSYDLDQLAAGYESVDRSEVAGAALSVESAIQLSDTSVEAGISYYDPETGMLYERTEQEDAVPLSSLAPDAEGGSEIFGEHTVDRDEILDVPEDVDTDVLDEETYVDAVTTAIATGTATTETGLPLDRTVLTSDGDLQLVGHYASALERRDQLIGDVSWSPTNDTDYATAVADVEADPETIDDQVTAAVETAETLGLDIDRVDIETALPEAAESVSAVERVSGAGAHNRVRATERDIATDAETAAETTSVRVAAHAEDVAEIAREQNRPAREEVEGATTPWTVDDAAEAKAGRATGRRRGREREREELSVGPEGSGGEATAGQEDERVPDPHEKPPEDRTARQRKETDTSKTEEESADTGELFCNECGGMVAYKRQRNGTLASECQNCGATERVDPDETADVKVTEEQRQQPARFISGEDSADGRAITDAACPSCEHERAFVQSEQIRAADEAETRMYECTDCGHKWRGDD